MDEQQEQMIIDYLREIANGVKDTFRLPTHATLFTTFKYACLLLVLSVISKVLKLFTFFTWQGVLLCVLALLVLLYIERSENSALQDAYNSAKRRAKHAKQKAAELGNKLKK